MKVKLIESKLNEGYIGQTVDDFMEMFVDKDFEVIIYGDEDDPIYQGPADEIPSNIKESGFIECMPDPTNPFNVNISDTAGDERMYSYYYETLQDLIDDCNLERISLWDANEEVIVFEGDIDNIPEQFLEWFPESIDGITSYISINADIEADFEDEDEIEFEDDLDESKLNEGRIPKQWKSLFQGDPKYFSEAIEIIRAWYEMEDNMEGFKEADEWDMIEMLDAATDPDEIKIVRSALGGDFLEDDLDESSIKEDWNDDLKRHVFKDALYSSKLREYKKYLDRGWTSEQAIDRIAYNHTHGGDPEEYRERSEEEFRDNFIKYLKRKGIDVRYRGRKLSAQNHIDSDLDEAKDTSKEAFLKNLARDTYEAGHPYDPYDFSLFRRECAEEGFSVTQKDFDKYFEYFDELRYDEYNEYDEEELDEAIEEHTCCICGKKFTGWGNNPWPVCKEEDAICCDDCNWEKVLPARIQNLKNKEDIN